MSKERIPYFNFYPTDFMRGVRGLTAQEVGIYTMLLCRMYEENGPVDLHDERLAAYCGCRTSTLVKALSRLCDLGKIVLVGKQIFNERAAIEIDKRNHVVKSNSTAGVLSAEKRKQNQRDAATRVEQPFNHTDTDTDTEKEAEKKEGASAQNSQNDVRLAIEAWASPDAASSFIAYRKKSKGKALTITAAKRLANNLKAIFDRGGDTDDALGLAEERGWQTVEADWYFNTKGNGNGAGNHNGGNTRPGPHNALMAGFAMAADRLKN